MVVRLAESNASEALLTHHARVWYELSLLLERRALKALTGPSLAAC